MEEDMNIFFENFIAQDRFKSLYSLYCNEIRCDLRLISENEESFYVHGFIIAAGIPRIRDIICGVHENLYRTTPVRLAEVKGRELRLAIEFAYLKQCEMPREAGAALELVMASLHLGVDTLYNMGMDALRRTLDMETVAQIFRPAPYPVTNVIHNLAEGHALRHLLSFDGSVSVLHEDKMVELLRDERLHAPCEEDAVLVAIRWVENSPTSRLFLFPRLLRVLRLGLLAPGSLELLARHPFVTCSTDAQLVLDTVHGTKRFYQRSMSANGAPPEWCRVPIYLRPRLPHSIIIFLGGWRQAVCDRTQIYDPLAERWMKVSSLTLPEPRVYHAVEVIEDQMFVMGGFHGTCNSHLDTCWSMNLRDDELRWEMVSNMNYSRSFLSSTILGGRIYVLGGRHANNDRLAMVESYTPSSNLWTSLPALPAPISDAGLTSLNGKLYMGGGYDGVTARNEVRMYDPENNSWRPAPSLSLARTGLKLVALQGAIYAIGGFDGTVRSSLVERYEPDASREWRAVSPMLVGRSNFAAVALHGRLMVMGGFTETGITATCEMYDPEENMWYPIEPLVAPTSGGSCCIVDDVSVARKFLQRESSRYRTWRPERPRPRCLSFAAAITSIPDDT